MTNRDIHFCIEDGCLMRAATTHRGNGRTYTHRCTKPVFEKVAYAVGEVPAEGKGTTLTQIALQEELPFTQVNVALEFLKERGIVDVRHRRCYPATPAVHLDAMTEFYALAEEPKSA
jgi:hypothetical protein